MTNCKFSLFFFSNVLPFCSLQFNGRKKLCLFKEDFSKDHYTVIQSVHNHTWYVGFNRKGKALKGSMYSKPKLRNCFHFVKREHNFGLQDTPRPGPKIKDPSKLKDLLTGRGPFRHRRIVPTTPPPRWTKWMISNGLVASLSCSCWVFLFSSYLDTRQDLGCFGHLFVFFLRFQPTAGERRTKEVPTRTDLPRSLEYSAYVAQCYLLTECRNFIIYYCHRCRASAFRFC